MKIKSILYIFLSFFLSCNSNEIVEKTIESDSYKHLIGYKNDKPIYQKLIDIKTNDILQIDSIRNDSMFTYADNVLRIKGKWKAEKNGQYNHFGWTLTYFENDIIALEEIGDTFIPETQFITINQLYILRDNKMDSLKSQFLKIGKLESGEDYIFLNSRNKEGMYKRSFLFGDNLSEVWIEELELKDGRNVINPPLQLLDGIRYNVRTFYIKDINDSIDFDNSSNMYIDYNAELNKNSNQKIDSLIGSIMNRK